MFNASSPSATAPVALLRGYTAAPAQPTCSSTPTSAGQLISRGTGVSVTAALAVGVSVVIGGSILFASTRRSVTEPTGCRANSSSSWWASVMSRLRIRGAGGDDDDEDAFASGTGTANLFDEEKSKARQELSRSKRADMSRFQTAASSTAPASGARAAAASAIVTTTASAAGTKAAPATARVAGFSTDADGAERMQQREQHMRLVRALLQREAGIAYDEDDDEDGDESSTDSDVTDVSLNYHLATAMEGNARDDLLLAFSAYGEASDGAVYGSTTTGDSDPDAEDMQVRIMVKTLEYLDMSNEREKLRSRRIALYRQTGRATPVSFLDADDVHGEGDEDDGIARDMQHQLAARHGAAGFGVGGYMGEEDEDMGDLDYEHGYGDYASALGRQTHRFESMMLGNTMMSSSAGGRADAGDSVLDRILGQGTSSRAGAAASGAGRNGFAGLHAEQADRMRMMEEEEGWGAAEDGDEEADFMAYLQQPDDAAHIYSRDEMRRARRDPAHDVRVVGVDDDLFGDEDAEDAWEEDTDDEDDDEDVIPWSRRDKADFERELFARIRQLAQGLAITDAEADREVLQEDARKAAAREQRRQQQQQQSPPPKAKTAAAATAPAPSTPPAAATRGDGESEADWEDEGDWEDDNEGDKAGDADEADWEDA
ncbi:hypothetical protein NESM_000476700 [Novymonas esmeraldas]|uniref:Uncharacterized protein n=1 Tax=Novymonas esmeraldas TaxID=1808958 RepID=A0AAW0EQK8_9TRYP